MEHGYNGLIIIPNHFLIFHQFQDMPFFYFIFCMFVLQESRHWKNWARRCSICKLNSFDPSPGAVLVTLVQKLVMIIPAH